MSYNAAKICSFFWIQNKNILAKKKTIEAKLSENERVGRKKKK